jgi:hypothetical protein
MRSVCDEPYRLILPHPQKCCCCCCCCLHPLHRWAGREMPAPPACSTRDTCVAPRPSSHFQGHTSSCHTSAPRAHQRLLHPVTQQQQMMTSSSHCCCCRQRHPLLATAATQSSRGQLSGQQRVRVRGRALLPCPHLLLLPLLQPWAQRQAPAGTAACSSSSSSKGDGSVRDWCRIHTLNSSSSSSSSSARLSRRHRWVASVCCRVCREAAVIWT